MTASGQPLSLPRRMTGKARFAWGAVDAGNGRYLRSADGGGRTASGGSRRRNGADVREPQAAKDPDREGGLAVGRKADLRISRRCSFNPSRTGETARQGACRIRAVCI